MTDNGEIYDDGTSIKNISVAGVSQKAAMFEQNNKASTPPVLRRLREKQQAESNGPPSFENKAAKPNASKPPWAAEKSNGTIPPKPQQGAVPQTSPKSPPNIPQKAKWSAPGSKVSTAGPKSPPPVVIKKPPPPSNSSNPWKKTPVATTNKDINDNHTSASMTGPSNFTKGTKRASVTDMKKNFQTEYNEKTEAATTKVVPLKDSNSVNITSKFKEEKLDKKTPETSPKTSIHDRIAALSKNNSDEPRIKPKPTIPPKAKTDQSVIKRKSDSRTFKRINQIQSPGVTPTKAAKQTDVDLTDLKDQYNALLIKYNHTNRVSDILPDEIYDDCDSSTVVVNKNKSNRPISFISPMTEDEEYDDVENLNRADSVTEETYDDCGNVAIASEEIYEPLDDIDEDVSQNDEKETLERKKKEEREQKEQEKKDKEDKKKKEKEEKDRQSKLKKKEKEEKDRMNKLKVNGTEKKIADGVIREEAKGVKLELPVKNGEKVTIMRMDNNPKGKWLVTNSEGKWGYVESTNVEAMNGEDCYMEADDVEGVAQDDELYEEV